MSRLCRSITVETEGWTGMLPYSGEAHAAILDALEIKISDEQWDAIEADVQPIGARPTVRLGAYFPGWHGVTEQGW